MVKVVVNNIMETSYGDGSCWVEYRVGDKLGYLLSETNTEKDSFDGLSDELNELAKDQLINKPDISSCGEFLSGIIEECRQSDNEMWFVETEDLEDIHSIDTDKQEKFLEDLEKDIEGYGLSEYIKVNDDGIPVTVYGGVITKFLF